MMNPPQTITRLTLVVAAAAVAVLALLVGLAHAWGALLTGGELAFITHRSDNYDIATVDLNTGMIWNMSRHRSHEDDFTWSPDGEYLLFVSTRDFNRDIFRVNAAGGGLEQLTRSLTNSTQPALSADGTKLAYVYEGSREDLDHEVYVLDMAEGSSINVSHHNGQDYNPVWSPDGSQIVFVSERNSEINRRLGSMANIRTLLYIVDANGENLRPLTDLSVSAYSPVWSPDGKTIAYAANASGQYDLYTLQVDTGETTRLTYHTGHDLQPAWSPDGQYIAFSSFRDDNTDIYMIDMAGHTTRITSHPAQDSAPSWSPDSLYLAFESVRDGERSIYIKSIYGSLVQRITPDGVYATLPQWRP